MPTTEIGLELSGGDEEIRQSSSVASPKHTSAHTSSSAEEPVVHRRLGVFSLAIITYYTVAASPSGLEATVRSAGVLPALIAIVTLAVTWAMPQALMTAELSAMIPENGGAILWAERGMGDFAAWIVAFNSATSNIIDQALYPILFASYISTTFDHNGREPLEMWQSYLVKVASLVVMTGANLRGLVDIARLSLVLVVVLVLPFIIQIPMGAERIWEGREGILSTRSNVGVGSLISTLLWNYSGFDRIGTLAGEVEHPGRTFPRGVSVGLIGITFMYTIPVAVAASIDHNWQDWKEGLFARVAGSIAPFLGVWVAVGVCASQLANGIAMLAGASRMLWQMAELKWVPHQLGFLNHAEAPWVAVLLNSVPVLGLCLLDFDTILVMDVMFNNVALVVEALAFILLRYTLPDTPRPFVVPGGLIFAWIITISKLAVIGVATVTAFAWVFIPVVCANVVFIGLYFYHTINTRPRFLHKETALERVAAFLGWPAHLRKWLSLPIDDKESRRLVDQIQPRVKEEGEDGRRGEDGDVEGCEGEEMVRV